MGTVNFSQIDNIWA